VEREGKCDEQIRFSVKRRPGTLMCAPLQQLLASTRLDSSVLRSCGCWRGGALVRPRPRQHQRPAPPVGLPPCRLPTGGVLHLPQFSGWQRQPLPYLHKERGQILQLPG